MLQSATRDAPEASRSSAGPVTRAIRQSDITVCAWGLNGILRDRHRKVTDLLIRLGLEDRLCRLVLTATGIPGHPLYLSKALPPTPWRPSEVRAA